MEDFDYLLRDYTGFISAMAQNFYNKYGKVSSVEDYEQVGRIALFQNRHKSGHFLRSRIVYSMRDHGKYHLAKKRLLVSNALPMHECIYDDGLSLEEVISSCDVPVEQQIMSRESEHTAMVIPDDIPAGMYFVNRREIGNLIDLPETCRTLISLEELKQSGLGGGEIDRLIDEGYIIGQKPRLCALRRYIREVTTLRQERYHADADFRKKLDDTSRANLENARARSHELYATDPVYRMHMNSVLSITIKKAREEHHRRMKSDVEYRRKNKEHITRAVAVAREEKKRRYEPMRESLLRDLVIPEFGSVHGLTPGKLIDMLNDKYRLLKDELYPEGVSYAAIKWHLRVLQKSG